MTDARWLDVAAAADSAGRHFRGAGEIFRAGGFDPGQPGGYRNLMALLHAMQSGYTSFETALVRIMEMLGENPPTDPDWHARLIERSAAAVPGLRAPIVGPEIAQLARKVRGFPHWAMHGYDTVFEPADAAAAIAAAEMLAGLIRPALDAFAASVDR